jgi:hypothetical protein
MQRWILESPMTDIEVMDVLIAKLRAAMKKNPNGYRQDQLNKALAERSRRLVFSRRDIKIEFGSQAQRSGGTNE